MPQAYLEHANITVSNPDATAEILCRLFDWSIRWSGDAMDNGYTVHVGGENSYLAIYTNANTRFSSSNNFETIKNLNHIGVVVKDIKAVEARVLAAGYSPNSHQQYTPHSASFYFNTLDDLEIEVVSYNE